MINYKNKIFKPVANSVNGEVDTGMHFLYQQQGNVLTSEYTGVNIIKGHLIALVGHDGTLDMRYHQVNKQGEIMTGTCKSTPEILPNGKIRLHEQWQWTSGDLSKGYSIMEEV
ncbi:hypothetical protein [Adhaeribacter aquaticus]|uniref:hypothetical protein n=1 Tax=Adhaeribacter aquaticus TaxID=299567 RepID=UPI00040CB284|nr:hypothetical protein [Adhaeribacter aquaticus]